MDYVTHYVLLCYSDIHLLSFHLRDYACSVSLLLVPIFMSRIAHRLVWFIGHLTSRGLQHQTVHGNSVGPPVFFDSYSTLLDIEYSVGYRHSA